MAHLSSGNLGRDRLPLNAIGHTQQQYGHVITTPSSISRGGGSQNRENYSANSKSTPGSIGRASPAAMFTAMSRPRPPYSNDSHSSMQSPTHVNLLIPRYPATPNNDKSGQSPTTSTPQMIKCSTCMNLVPLLQLSEHICSSPRVALVPHRSGGDASNQQTDKQYKGIIHDGHRARQFSSDESASESDPGQSKRGLASNLRINVIQAQQTTGIQPALGTPYSSRGLSPSNGSGLSLDRSTPSPVSSSASSSSAPWARPRLASNNSSYNSGANQGRLSPLQHTGSGTPQSAPLPSENEKRFQQSPSFQSSALPRSASSSSSLSAVAVENRAGIGAFQGEPLSTHPFTPTGLSASPAGSINKLPFFEKYQRVYGNGGSPTSSSDSNQVSPSSADRQQPISYGSQPHATPRNPIPSAWSASQSSSTTSSGSLSLAAASISPPPRSGSYSASSTTPDSKEPQKSNRPALPHQNSDEISRAQQAYNRYGQSATYREREISRERQREQNEKAVRHHAHHAHQQRRRIQSSSEESEQSSSSRASASSSSGFSGHRNESSTAGQNDDEDGVGDVSATMGFLATPDTSPDMPSPAAFPSQQNSNAIKADFSANNPSHRDPGNTVGGLNAPRSTSPGDDFPEDAVPSPNPGGAGPNQATDTWQTEPSAAAYQADEAEDFIDSYPTPQPALFGRFTGRFGSLVVNDESQTTDPADLAQPDSSEGGLWDMNIKHGRWAKHDDDHPTPRVPQLGDFAGGVSESFGNTNGGQGLGLDACLDDLMREMSKQSLSVPNGKPQEAKNTFLDVSGSNINDTAYTYQQYRGLAPSPVLSSSSPILDRFHQGPVSPLLRSTSLPGASHETRTTECAACHAVLASDSHSGPVVATKDGKSFCKDCYGTLYLPKCQKCTHPIEGKAIGSGDGKVKGKFHPKCFACFECAKPFPTGDFYVFNYQPFCARHYHALNGTLCANPACTMEGIEGPCVSLVGEENGNGGRYHPACFACADPACSILLDQYHYVLSGLPYCEFHAHAIEDREEAEELAARSPYSGRPVTPASYKDDNNASYFNLETSPSPYAPSPSLQHAAHQPPTGMSITALRKNSATPLYNSRSRQQQHAQSSSDTVQQQQYQPYQPQQSSSKPWAQSRPNPPSGPGLNTMRRAEKRRTVIQRI